MSRVGTSGSTATRSELADLVELAEMRHRDPRLALGRTRLLLAASARSVETQIVGDWVIGLCFHELGRLPSAVRHYRASIRAAEHAGFADHAAVARASLAVSLVGLGETDAARRERAIAIDEAPEQVAPVVGLLGALVLQRTGALGGALEEYARVLPRLREGGRQAWVARLLVNRGVLLAYRGEVDAAVDDLREAEALAGELGLVVLVAMAAHNLGFAESRKGRPIEALRAFDRAEQAYVQLGRPRRLLAVLDSDRCEVLLTVGLTSDACRAASSAVAALDRPGDRADLAEARLLHAQACLADGQLPLAAAEAAAAAAMLHEAERPAWAALAEHVGLQAEMQALSGHGRPAAGLLARARTIALALEDQGWPVEAMQARTSVGELALALGRRDVARVELGAARRGLQGPARLRVQAWRAVALLRVADGDEGGAVEAVTAGMDVVDEHRAALGATELRTRAAGLGSALARLGTRLALRQGRPEAIFAWSERWRANSLSAEPIRPPDDPEQAADLARLRRLVGEEREAKLAGAQTGQMQAEIEGTERSIRDRTLRLAPCGQAGSVVTPSAADIGLLQRRLGPRTLVELIELDGVLRAVVVGPDGVFLRRLGRLANVDMEKRHLLFALRRLASAAAGSPQAIRARQSAEVAAAELERLLIRPLRLPAGGDVIIVPTGLLHGMPWATLPALRAGSVELTPSAALWLRPPRPPRHHPKVVLVAGPDLAGAEVEIARLGTIHPRASVLAREDATTASVLDAFARADLLHICAHGHFRADSALFSRLALADGPLTVYDVERIRCRVATVVLPACEAAVTEVLAGDEVVGTAAALLANGVQTVIAPILPIPDLASVDVMVELHRRLRDGLPPARALAAAVRETYTGGDPQAIASASAFVCIGSDRGTPTA